MSCALRETAVIEPRVPAPPEPHAPARPGQVGVLPGQGWPAPYRSSTARWHRCQPQRRGHPCAMRASVGSDTPMRLAHARMDSLRRLRATARLAPHSRSRVRTAGGISASALDCVDTTQMFAKSLLSKAFYIFDPDKRDTRLEPGTGQGPMPVNIFCRAGKRSRETRAKHGHDPCHCRLDEACRADLAQVKLWGVALARRRSTGSRPIGLRWPSVGHQLASGRGSVDDAASRRAVHQK